MNSGWFSGPGVGVLDTRYVNVTGDTMTGALEVQANIRIRSNNELRFYDNGNFVGFEAPALAADQIWVLPTADGAAGEALATNGAGALSWGADHGVLGELGLDQHPLSIITTPLASARNVIAAPTATIRPLTVQTTDNNVAENLTEWQNSVGNPVAAINRFGQLGVGQDVGSLNNITSLITHTDPAATSTGAFFDTRVVYTANNSQSVISNFGDILLNQRALNGTNITGSAIALRNRARVNGSSGTVNNLVGVLSQGGNIGAGTLVNFFSFKITSASNTGGGILANNYGLYIDDQSVGDALNFSIFTNLGDVRFGDAVAIDGSAAADVQFTVNLFAAQSANAVEIIDSNTNTLWLIEHDGGQAISQAVVTTGGPTPSLLITGAAHTALTASTERHEVNLDLSATQQWATGDFALQRFVNVDPPTMSAVAASTIDEAITVYIGGAPIAGANVTLTQTAAFVVASGFSGFGETSPTGTVHISAPTATIRPLAIQTTDDDTTNPLTAWLASGGGTVAFVGAKGDADFEGHVAIGAGAAVSATEALSVVETYTSNAGILVGMNSTMDFAPTGNHTAEAYALLFTSTLTTAQTRTGGGLWGLFGRSIIANGIDARDQNLIGGFFSTDVEDAGSGGGIGAIVAAGLDATTPFVDTGNALLGYGLRITQGTVGAGSIATLNGINIADINAGTINFAIQTHAGNVVFNAGGDASTDIRVAGGSITNLLFTDAGNDQVETHGGRIEATTRIVVGASPYTTLNTDHVILCDTDGGAITVDLQAGVEGRNFKIINVGTSGNDVTVDGNAGETVYGALTAVLADGEVVNTHYNVTEGWW